MMVIFFIVSSWKVLRNKFGSLPGCWWILVLFQWVWSFLYSGYLYIKHLMSLLAVIWFSWTMCPTVHCRVGLQVVYNGSFLQRACCTMKILTRLTISKQRPREDRTYHLMRCDHDEDTKGDTQTWKDHRAAILCAISWPLGLALCWGRCAVVGGIIWKQGLILSLGD